MFKHPSSSGSGWLEDDVAADLELPGMRPSIRRCALCKERHLVGDSDTISSQSSQQCVFCGLWWHSACVEKLFAENTGYTKSFADNHNILLTATKKSCPNPKQYETSWWDMLLGHMPIASGSGPTSTSPSSLSPVPALMRTRLVLWAGTVRLVRYGIPNTRDSGK